VMGERAAAHTLATTEEAELMAKLAADAIEAGAVGFSTSRTLNHKSISGELTPSYAAGREELTTIARAIGATGKGVLQLVTDWDDESIETDFDLIRSMVAAAGRPMSFSLSQTAANPTRFRKALGFLEQANAEGHRLRAQVAARGIGILLGLELTLNPFVSNPAYQRIAHLPLAERARRMADP